MVLDRFKLDGRVAIVTGASRGIGAASALALAECGADVVIAARTEDALSAVAKQIVQLGRKAETVPADLDDLANLATLVDTAMASFSRIDIVVNVVGGTYPRPFMDTSAHFLEEAFHWNVTTAFELTRLAVPHMLERDGGAVVNISSAMGRLRDRGFAAYATAKAALEHLTHSMAADLAPRIRVNAVAPGAIETEALASVLNDEMRQTMVSMTPMRRLGRTDDIAAAVVYLASDAASFVTGKVLQVDGGIETPNLPLGLPDL